MSDTQNISVSTAPFLYIRFDTTSHLKKGLCQFKKCVNDKYVESPPSPQTSFG